MEARDGNSQRIPPGDDAAMEHGLNVAVLALVAAGAALDDIPRLLEGTPRLDGRQVRRVVADLQKSGLLRPASGREGSTSLAPTDRGRDLVVAQVARWAADAARVEEERRQVERLRTDLLATISHELRTPLTLIRTSIGLLLDSDPDAAMRQRLLRNIKQSTDRMHLLVGDLLDLARLRGDRFDLQVRSVDLGELVAGAVSLLRPLSDEKAQEVEVALPAPAPVVPGDYRRLERVLLNLLGNAIKFAPPAARIAVTVREGAREVTVAVRDSGPGIPAEAMPHLFDQFFTARTSSTRHNIGTGLGLPIAKGIVEAHGGRIWVESRAGAGATVSFTLPRFGAQEGGDEGSGDR